MDLQTRTFTIETRDAGARSVRVVASTEAIDSYGDVVRQDWRLERYRRNPTVLYAHNAIGFLGPFKPEETLPIGRASDVAIVGGALEATIHFASAAANPLAERVYQGVREKTIRGVSVGFKPGRIAKVEQPDGTKYVELSENELFEISICPIGANPEAVVKAFGQRRAADLDRLLAARGIERPTSRRLLERVMCGSELTEHRESPRVVPVRQRTHIERTMDELGLGDEYREHLRTIAGAKAQPQPPGEHDRHSSRRLLELITDKI